MLPPWWTSGITLSGRVLAEVGVQIPAMFPEYTHLLRATAATTDANGHRRTDRLADPTKREYSHACALTCHFPVRRRTVSTIRRRRRLRRSSTDLHQQRSKKRRGGDIGPALLFILPATVGIPGLLRCGRPSAAST